MSSLEKIFNPTDQHIQLRDLVSRFAKKEIEPQAKEHDEKDAFNSTLFKRCAELGLFGITIPEKYGGYGLDAVASVIVHEEMSRADPAFTLSYLAHEVLFINNLGINGSAEQKDRYLPRAIIGDIRCGIAMTEPSGGTDVLGMKTTARRDGRYWILNGTKQFITNFDGDAFLVYARTGQKKYDISMFIVEPFHEGFSTGRKEDKMGMRQSSTGQLVFQDCKVPIENLVGEENKATELIMRNLAIERVTLAAMSSGIAQECLDIMNKYASDRKAFERPIREYGQIQQMLADSYAEILAARLLVYKAAMEIDPSKKASLYADASKLLTARVGENVARRAIQVLGGYGYCREYPVERFFRDAILLTIGGGTTEALQKNITKGLGR